MSNELQTDELSALVARAPAVEEPVADRYRRGQGLERPQSGADALAGVFAELGVRRAFGLLGGGIAQVCGAMRRAGIEVIHARHETGAAFMATEAHFASDEPVVVYTTTGPGATNAITGLVSAAWDGAKIIMVTGGTNPAERGRIAFQETRPESLDLTGWLSATSNYFEHTIENVGQISLLRHSLAQGLAKHSGFLANVTFPVGVQSARGSQVRGLVHSLSSLEDVSPTLVDQIQERLQPGKFVIWVGFGARKASAAIREFAERTGAPVMASARAKGVFPESHPQYLGVTGMFGGHPWVQSYFRAHQPDHVLVLGSRLGQTTSCFDPTFAPRHGFVHVDVEPSVFGIAYPDVDTLGVTAEIGALIEALNERWPAASAVPVAKLAVAPSEEHGGDGPIHPRSLMAAVQRVVVDGSDAMVMADAGNAFAWANAELRFEEPGRYRTTSAFVSMTKASSGIVGAALGGTKPAVAIVGDGSMLMGNEVSTAVQHDAPAKWIVLNDGSYGMVRHGMIAIGMEPFATAIPSTNFAMLASALGAKGLRVQDLSELDAALEEMLATAGPVVVDVAIDPRVAPPFGRRNEALSQQGE